MRGSGFSILGGAGATRGYLYRPWKYGRSSDSFPPMLPGDVGYPSDRPERESSRSFNQVDRVFRWFRRGRREWN